MHGESPRHDFAPRRRQLIARETLDLFSAFHEGSTRDRRYRRAINALSMPNLFDDFAAVF